MQRSLLAMRGHWKTYSSYAYSVFSSSSRVLAAAQLSLAECRSDLEKHTDIPDPEFHCLTFQQACPRNLQRPLT